MTVGSTMKWMGRSARSRTAAMGHQLKDRALEKRLERTADEAERLRVENEMLRDEVAESRAEHHRIMDLLETKFANPPEVEVEVEKKERHPGRWLLFLAAIGGAIAWMRSRSNGSSEDEWSGQMSRSSSVTETGTAGI